MILDSLFEWFAGAVHSVLAMLPGIPSISGLGTVSSQVWQYAQWANDYVPLDQACLILGIVMAAWTVFYGARFFEWVLTKLHILGGN